MKSDVELYNSVQQLHILTTAPQFYPIVAPILTLNPSNPHLTLRFMKSEVELHDSVQQLHVLATAPQFYPIVAELNSVASLLSLLTHDNAGWFTFEDIYTTTAAVPNITLCKLYIYYCSAISFNI